MDEPRIILTLKDGTSFLTVNPFRVADEIRRLVGDVTSAKPNAAGALIITPAEETQITAFLKLDQFLGREATFDAPGSTVEAYAYAPSLSGVSDEELLTQLAEQGVVGVTRLRKRHDQPNPGIRLRFRGASFPPKIRAGFEDFELRPWQRSPLLCRRCATHGHLKKHCRATYVRCLKCAEDHQTDDCSSTKFRCPHCAEDHPAWDRRCRALEANASKQGRHTSRSSAAVKMEASTQTWISTRDAYTRTQKTATVHRSCGTSRPTKTSETQTGNGLATAESASNTDLSEDAESTEEPDWWRRRTRQHTRSAAVPPPVPERPQQLRPELLDEELFPTTKTDKAEADHDHIFRYEDGSLPATIITYLHRFGSVTRVVDLNLRPGSKAHKAASRGFYYDNQNLGKRLYLKPL